MTKLETHDVNRIELGPIEPGLIGFTRTLTYYSNGQLVQINLYASEPLALTMTVNDKTERTQK